ncbi:hypothetical protein [Bradyrhizobium genosp. A]|uniref:hypothetical protein n=1 Tax=Bradyrhizobium genosp. A TaxID=83626 RepID=UPI003CEF558A
MAKTEATLCEILPDLRPVLGVPRNPVGLVIECRGEVGAETSLQRAHEGRFRCRERGAARRVSSDDAGNETNDRSALQTMTNIRSGRAIYDEMQFVMQLLHLYVWNRDRDQSAAAPPMNGTRRLNTVVKRRNNMIVKKRRHLSLQYGSGSARHCSTLHRNGNGVSEPPAAEQ